MIQVASCYRSQPDGPLGSYADCGTIRQGAGDSLVANQLDYTCTSIRPQSVSLFYGIRVEGPLGFVTVLRQLCKGEERGESVDLR